MSERMPDSIAEPMRRCPDYPDFPSMWAIQRDRGAALMHDPNCSVSAGLLCDCGAIKDEWERLRRQLFVPGDALDRAALAMAARVVCKWHCPARPYCECVPGSIAFERAEQVIRTYLEGRS